MALSMQTIAFLMNYVNSKFDEAGNVSVESIHIDKVELNETGDLVFTFNKRKEPIIVQLDELIQSSPEIQASIKEMIEENNKTIY